MRVLIFGEDVSAQAALKTQRAAGHHASLRSLQFFTPAEYEPCELAMTDAPEVAAVYAARGVAVAPITVKDNPPALSYSDDAPATDAPSEPAEKPKPRSRK